MSERQTVTGFTLWHRASKYVRWRAVASAATEAELTAKLRTLPSGDAITLPAGQHPNERSTTRA